MEGVRTKKEPPGCEGTTAGTHRRHARSGRGGSRPFRGETAGLTAGLPREEGRARARNHLGSRRHGHFCASTWKGHADPAQLLFTASGENDSYVLCVQLGLRGPTAAAWPGRLPVPRRMGQEDRGPKEKQAQSERKGRGAGRRHRPGRWPPTWSSDPPCRCPRGGWEGGVYAVPRSPDRTLKFCVRPVMRVQRHGCPPDTGNACWWLCNCNNL